MEAPQQEVDVEFVVKKDTLQGYLYNLNHAYLLIEYKLGLAPQDIGRIFYLTKKNM